MKKVFSWGLQLCKKSYKSDLIPEDTYMPYSNFKNDNVIIGACIRMVAEGQSPIEVSFDADVLTGQRILGQWSHNVDSEGKPVIEKRKYRVLTLSVEYEEID